MLTLFAVIARCSATSRRRGLWHGSRVDWTHKFDAVALRRPAATTGTGAVTSEARMKALVVGAGGREHALCWALAASPLIGRLYCAPGSDAIAREATCVPLAIDDLAGIVAFCRDEGIELVVLGPELSLVLGLVDRLEE